MLTFRLSSIITRGSGLLSLIFIFLTLEQLEQSFNTRVDASPRDLLQILTEIQIELGENITDKDLIHQLEHGGVVEGAKNAISKITDRYWNIHKKIIKNNLNKTNEVQSPILEDHHKIEVPKLEDDLSDPLTLPFEAPDPPGSINPHNYQWIYNPSNRCKRDGTYFLILIKSKEENYQVRHTIRETWCSETTNTTCMFLVGRDNTLQREKIRAEANYYKDILMEEISDDDSIRKVIMGLKWSFKYCPKAKYILKTNDNVWINIKRFTEYFESNSISDHFFGGKCVMTKPNRDPKSEKYISRDAYEPDILPIVCSETGYLFTADLIKSFYEASLNVAPVIRYDEIYMALIANALQIMPRATSGFNYGKYLAQRACEYKANAFTLLLGGRTPSATQELLTTLNSKILRCQ